MLMLLLFEIARTGLIGTCKVWAGKSQVDDGVHPFVSTIVTVSLPHTSSIVGIRVAGRAKHDSPRGLGLVCRQ
jgi:hypothetical protein